MDCLWLVRIRFASIEDPNSRIVSSSKCNYPNISKLKNSKLLVFVKVILHLSRVYKSH